MEPATNPPPEGDPRAAAREARDDSERWTRGLITRMTSAISLVSAAFIVAIAAIVYALVSANSQVDDLTAVVNKQTATNQCRSEVAQEEAAALDDIVIALLRARDHPLTSDEVEGLVGRLEAAKTARDDIVANGCAP